MEIIMTLEIQITKKKLTNLSSGLFGMTQTNYSIKNILWSIAKAMPLREMKILTK